MKALEKWFPFCIFTYSKPNAYYNIFINNNPIAFLAYHSKYWYILGYSFNEYDFKNLLKDFINALIYKNIY